MYGGTRTVGRVQIKTLFKTECLNWKKQQGRIFDGFNVMNYFGRIKCVQYTHSKSSVKLKFVVSMSDKIHFLLYMISILTPK